MLKLIRTGNPNEVLLTDVGYQTEIDYGQLFHKMPIGYLIRNSAILFDTELHCVYIIENLMKHVTQFSVKSGDSKQINIKLHRNNIPYEKFFKCDNDLSKVEHTLGKFRCDLEYKSNEHEHLNKNDESLIEVENEVKPVVQSNKRLWLNLLTTISNNWITFVVGGIVSFVLLLFIIILFVYRKQTVNYRKSTVRKLLNRSPKTKKVKNTSYNSTSKPTTSGKGSYKNQTTT
ncbi:hypothetical protein RDWZM_006488 [Blomia tropicalis]|uniref:Uncharacterized protein n=1 Tax=Blomia tropicalis TaxID=40697 RepID=A0A9Q0RPE1_BLOTA|nr:hypothetical protein RDWZM_006488 [Blomia tropicalis]